MVAKRRSRRKQSVPVRSAPNESTDISEVSGGTATRRSAYGAPPHLSTAQQLHMCPDCQENHRSPPNNCSFRLSFAKGVQKDGTWLDVGQSRRLLLILLIAFSANFHGIAL
jgi:hypothetical protein